MILLILKSNKSEKPLRMCTRKKIKYIYGGNFLFPSDLHSCLNNLLSRPHFILKTCLNNEKKNAGLETMLLKISKSQSNEDEEEQRVKVTKSSSSQNTVEYYSY